MCEVVTGQRQHRHLEVVEPFEFTVDKSSLALDIHLGSFWEFHVTNGSVHVLKYIQSWSIIIIMRYLPINCRKNHSHCFQKLLSFGIFNTMVFSKSPPAWETPPRVGTSRRPAPSRSSRSAPLPSMGKSQEIPWRYGISWTRELFLWVEDG